MSIHQDVYEKLGIFYLGRRHDRPDVPILYDSRDLLTHAVALGMTGSGKTGLCLGLLEEAMMDSVPAIVIDPKGDIGNLLLTFEDLSAKSFEPWVDAEQARREGISTAELAQREATKWERGLHAWGQSEERIKRLHRTADVCLYTPGSKSGRPVSMLSSLAAPPAEERDDFEAFSDRLEGTTASLLGMAGVDGDPLIDPEHTLVSNILNHFWSQGEDVSLADLIRTIQKPPFTQIGVMPLDQVMPPKSRIALANRLNNLVASPGFRVWMEGEPLDIDTFLHDEAGRPRVSIFSIAHLSERERMFFVSMLLNRMLSWMRKQRGTSSLRALLYMDEVFGYLPPTAKPPSKKPLLTMLKQARAYGLGLVLATQNPADLDYKALSNTGTWFLGRLQTERDRMRVLEGLSSATEQWGSNASDLEDKLAALESRSFLLHNVHSDEPVVFQTRWVMSYLKGPLTNEDIKLLTAQSPAAPVEPEAREEHDAGGERVSTPQGIDEWFFPIHVPAPAASTLLFRPMVYGWGGARFNDRKLHINETVDFGWIAPVKDGPVPLDWEQAFRIENDPNTFTAEPPADGEFLPPASAALEPKNYKSWRTSLINHVVDTETLPLLECPSLKLTSQPNESEREFRRRVKEALRERRDDELDATNSRYRKKLERIEAKVSRLGSTAQEQKAQAEAASTDKWMAVGGGIFDAFTGRSARSSAKRAMAGSRKADREQGQADRAAAALAEAREERSDMGFEFEQALSRVAAQFAPETYPIEQRAIRLKKNGVEIEFFALVWIPYWQAPDGTKVRAI